MDKTRFESLKKAWGRWSTWALWDNADITNTDIIEKNVKALNPNVVFIGLNASRDISDGWWRNFHLNYRACRNLRDMLSAPPWRGAYITDLFKGAEYVHASAAEIKKRLAGKPALAAKAFKDLDSELALAGAKAPRLFFLGLAVREVFSRYAPGRINPVLLRHPSEQGGTFFEVNRPILAAIAQEAALSNAF